MIRASMRPKCPYNRDIFFYEGRFPHPLLGLHNFLSKVPSTSNFCQKLTLYLCYLTSPKSYIFQKKKTLQKCLLSTISSNFSLVSTKISQIKLKMKDTHPLHLLLLTDNTQHPAMSESMYQVWQKSNEIPENLRYTETPIISPCST